MFYNLSVMFLDATPDFYDDWDFFRIMAPVYFSFRNNNCDTCSLSQDSDVKYYENIYIFLNFIQIC